MSDTNDEKIITPDSPEAATYRTDIRGWVSRDGRFFGDGADAEYLARHQGATHTKCVDCENFHPKGYFTSCDDCRARRDYERYLARPRAKWDGKAMLYSEALDKFFDSPEDALDYAYLEDDENPMPLEDMRLVICEPDYAGQIDSSYWEDQLPEDGEIPSDLEEALGVFNKAISGILLSWHPGKYALDLSVEASGGGGS